MGCSLLFIFILLLISNFNITATDKQTVLEEEDTDLKVEKAINFKQIELTGLRERWKRDIVYKEVDGEDLTLDLFLPEREDFQNTPVILYIHGGGFIRGDKSEIFELSSLFQAWLQEGWAVASVNYRLLYGDTMFPDNVEDVASALKWLEKNGPKFNLNIEQIGLVGHSAGGNLALLTGLSKENSVQFIVSMAGPTKLYGSEDFELRKKLMEIINQNDFDNKILQKASPIDLLDESGPPILLVHGTDDNFVPYEQSRIFHEKALELGADCRLLTIEGGGHVLAFSYLPRMHVLKDDIMNFMKTNIQ